MSRVKHIQQPPGSNLCGQACVAMLLGVTLEQAIQLVGKKGKTNTRDLLKALGSLALEPRLVPVRQRPIPTRALGKLTWEKNRSHWVILWDGYVYDPLLDKAYEWKVWEAYISDHPVSRVTSTLKVGT